MPTKDPTSTPRAAAALDAVRPGINRAARQLLLGQARGESDYGNAFSTPDGSNSNNWGAIYANGTHDPPTIPVGDTYEGKPIIMKGAWNNTVEDGARQFSKLVLDNYKVGPFAETGDAWGYARSLWRDGPGSKRPSYYMGFPPGHKWSLAPAGTKPLSPQDYYYRVLAYAKMIAGAAGAVAKLLGEPSVAFVKPPPPPAEGEPLPPADWATYAKDTGTKSAAIESGVKSAPTVEDLGGDTRPTTAAEKEKDAALAASLSGTAKKVADAAGGTGGVIAIILAGGGLLWFLTKK
jgi:hypothetical protein